MESGDEENKIESDDENKNKINERVENGQEGKIEQLNLNEEISQINKINLNDKEEDDNMNVEEKTNYFEDMANESQDISLINIEAEKEKNNALRQKEKEEKKNKNKINIIKDDEDEEEEDPDENDLDSYMYKCNKEYSDKDDDLHSRRITTKDNNDDYLMNQEENGNEKDVLGEYKNDEEGNDEEEEEEKLFPFKIVGDGTKKGGPFGKYHSRYFEIDSIKGLFKRYTSSKEYPKNPKEVIEIKNFTLIEKKKLTKEFNDIEITYTLTNSKGKKSEKKESLRFRHLTCRNAWFDYLLTLWKCYASNTPPPKFTKQILSFIDDRLGIIQEIGRGRKTKREGGKKKFKMDLNKFKVLSLLGIGGFGTVFKVRHIMTGKIYAMKVMNKNYIIQKKYLHYVVSEFKIMKLISGFPFVLDLHYCFQSSNYLYLIIDYCPNGDFTNLESMNNLKLFFAEVVLAFEYIHNKGVIYRDLKPENILLDQTGHVKLCDFNLAKAGMTKTKRAFSFCGSPLYFSPEMVMNKGVTYKCDVYGIGVLMYEMVTGKMAFEANYIKELYEKIKKNDIDYNHPKLTGDIKDLIMKMCAKDENDRIDLEEVKKHKYFEDIDFDKVINKKYGNIVTVKKDSNKKKKKKINQELSAKEKEDMEYQKFMKQQKKLDDDKSLTILNGKITLKEMKLDQVRPMKMKVKEFYFVKKEDSDEAQEFQLEVNGTQDISSLIMDQYDA